MEPGLVSSWAMFMSFNASLMLRVNSEKAGKGILLGR